MPIIPNDNPQPWSPPAWLVEKREAEERKRKERERRRKAKRKWREKHPEAAAECYRRRKERDPEAFRKWRLAYFSDPEKGEGRMRGHLESNKRSYQRNKGRILERQREYNRLHKDEINARRREKYKERKSRTNPEKQG